ncbi:hypothetical protein MJO29_010193 [Puccinia striiformis f. sp. tritici]|nr:hypothetical protein MJO29_010193 [Puccinia striiformis f. sp. tritici]
MRDTWNVANTLREKQDLAVMASNVLDELAQLRNAASVKTPNYQPQLPPPPPPAATPMDIDSITASSGFTFPLYRAICIKNKLCQRCHKGYNKAHITNRSCPNVEVSIKEKIDLYSRLSRGQNPVPLAEINLSSINPDVPVQSWDSVGINSFADMLMFGSDEEGNIINQGELSFSIASLSSTLPLPPNSSSPPLSNTDPSRLVIPIKLLLPGLSPVTAMALIDSGAGGSFINKDFVRTKNIKLTELPFAITCRSFDGSPASSGDVTHCWNGQITGSDFLNHSNVSHVSLNVVSLSSVDVILGLPLLKDNLAWVGGPYGPLFFSSHSDTSNRILPISTQSLSIASITNNILLNQEEILSLPSVLRSFSDVFTIASLQALPPVRPQFDLKIQLKPDCTPPFGGLYNLSESERRQLREYIDKNLSKGFIRLSSSPAAASIFFVKTQGKDDRPCVDYRGLNQITIRNSYPIPVLSLLLNNLAGCKYLSKVDLKSAFNLLRVTPGQEHLTAFRTPWGLFEYMVMPFGLANAPATFQRFIQYVLREYIDVCCFVYIDDILIFSKTEEDHIEHLKAILTKLREYSLKASLKKCQFFQTQVQFLGFIISSQGLRMDPLKLDTILKWPVPETLKGLRRFLGFCNFYRRFIPRFSAITSELTQLTKELSFHPNSMEQDGPKKAFQRLLAAFTSAPLLSHFSFTADRVVHVDSSGFAIAGVLSQPDDTGRLRPTLSPKQARWAAYLDSFNFKLIHLSGVSNPADAPSRRPDFDDNSSPLVPNSLAPRFQISALETDTHQKAEHDLYFQPISSSCSDLIKSSYSSLTDEEKLTLHFQNNLYWFRHRVFVPSGVRDQIIKTYHEGPMIGHPGIARTLSLLLRTFDWPSIRKDVISFVSSCNSCQRVKSARQSPVGTLQSFPIPSRPWDVIGMDFITKLPKSGNFDSILVVIDHLSKATHFIPCKEAMSASELAKLFRREIFRLHGLPDRIISDRGTTFTCEFWQAFMKLLNIKSATSTAYHPQTDGQTERMNQILEDYLRHFVNYNQTDWSEKLDLAEFSINNLHSTSLGVSPFFFIHGYHPRFNTLTTPSGKSQANKVVQDLQEIQDKATTALRAAKEKQALYYNKHRRDTPIYNPGDQVLLSRRFIQTRRPNSKLDFRHLGPFSVVKMIGERAVLLNISEHYPKLHPVFNVALLTPYKDPISNPFRANQNVHPQNHTNPFSEIDWNFFGEVLDYRSKRKGSDEYLIRWKNSTPAHDRWLPLSIIPHHIHNTLIQHHKANKTAIPLLLISKR